MNAYVVRNMYYMIVRVASLHLHIIALFSSEFEFESLCAGDVAALNVADSLSRILLCAVLCFVPPSYNKYKCRTEMCCRGHSFFLPIDFQAGPLYYSFLPGGTLHIHNDFSTQFSVEPKPPASSNVISWFRFQASCRSMSVLCTAQAEAAPGNVIHYTNQ